MCLHCHGSSPCQVLQGAQEVLFEHNNAPLAWSNIRSAITNIRKGTASYSLRPAFYSTSPFCSM